MTKVILAIEREIGVSTYSDFPRLKKIFHVHLDAPSITLGVVLMKPGEGDIDQPIPFSSHKLSSAKNNYTTTKREGLAMVSTLQKLRHYFLGSHFKFFTDHLALHYFLNKPVLGGRIYH